MLKQDFLKEHNIEGSGYRVVEINGYFLIQVLFYKEEREFLKRAKKPVWIYAPLPELDLRSDNYNNIMYTPAFSSLAEAIASIPKIAEKFNEKPKYHYI